MATIGSIVSERTNAGCTRLCRLQARPQSPPPPDRTVSQPLSLPTLALFVLASCLLLSPLAPRASAVGDHALGDTSAATLLAAQRTASSSDADQDSGSGSNDGAFVVAPVHVFRNPTTGKLVEVAEPERREDEQQLDSAAALAAELDALYMEDVAPVRSHGSRAAKLGRKSSLDGLGGSGSSSVKGNAARVVKEGTPPSSSSDPTAAAVSASSLGSGRATRGSRRGARRLSFGH